MASCSDSRQERRLKEKLAADEWAAALKVARECEVAELAALKQGRQKKTADKAGGAKTQAKAKAKPAQAKPAVAAAAASAKAKTKAKGALKPGSAATGGKGKAKSSAGPSSGKAKPAQSPPQAKRKRAATPPPPLLPGQKKRGRPFGSVGPARRAAAAAAAAAAATPSVAPWAAHRRPAVYPGSRVFVEFGSGDLGSMWYGGQVAAFRGLGRTQTTFIRFDDGEEHWLPTDLLYLSPPDGSLLWSAAVGSAADFVLDSDGEVSDGGGGGIRILCAASAVALPPPAAATAPAAAPAAAPPASRAGGKKGKGRSTAADELECLPPQPAAAVHRAHSGPPPPLPDDTDDADDADDAGEGFLGFQAPNPSPVVGRAAEPGLFEPFFGPPGHDAEGGVPRRADGRLSRRGATQKKSCPGCARVSAHLGPSCVSCGYTFPSFDSAALLPLPGAYFEPLYAPPSEAEPAEEVKWIWPAPALAPAPAPAPLANVTPSPAGAAAAAAASQTPREEASAMRHSWVRDSVVAGFVVEVAPAGN